jgi:protein TonB
MNVYAARNKPGGFLSRRAIGFMATAALHVLIVYGLITGLARSVVEVIKGPIETKIIEQVEEEDTKPPPPPPVLDKPPPPFVPPPEIAITTEAPVSQNVITTQSKAPVAPKPVAAVVPPRSNPKRPVTQPEYPPSSKRAGEEGVVVLQLYVKEDGRVGDAKVEKSSGFPKLDEAALKEALRNWKLLPATQDGKPLAMWYSFRVVFKIEN